AQIYFTAWQAVPLISVLALGSGTLVIMQATSQLNVLGGTKMIGQLLVMIVIRELGPLLTALIVIARSGTAVASELGTMKINKETEALEALGIHPLSYIVFPRLLGGIISVLSLAVFFNFVAIMGGYLFSRVVLDIPFHFYFDSLSAALTLEDVGIFLLKNTFSGTIIFIVCCYQGLSVKQSPHEVPQVTMKAVVNSIIYVMTFNFAVTAIYYFSTLKNLGLI
ncbi:MAG: ABC transporter permease, partial [Bdellovibrionales bacterium]|nr:ABC transporter permease [Bdellovibrionales bacterium]